MEAIVLVVLALVVAAVAIDAIARIDERRPRSNPQRDRDQSIISTQKIIVDLTRRR